MLRETAIITGAAKRVGAAMALYFAARGFDIALHYHSSKDEAELMRQAIKKIGVECEIFAHDLNDIKGLTQLIETIFNTMPRCSVLVNNASVFERCEFLETTETLYDRQFNVNFKAPFFLSQAFAKKLGNQKNGSIIHIMDTDIAQIQTSHFAYLLSKKLLADFTEMGAKALGSNIRVNAVCPGSMLPSSENYPGYEEKVKQAVPLKNQPSLDDLSEAVYWLCKQASITGQIIHVDCGKHLL